MDVEIAKIIVQGGISGISFFAIWILKSELDKNREIMKQLIEVNEKQNVSMADLKNEVVRINERIKS